MKKYEIVYIIHPDLEGSTSKITEKIKSILEKSGGKVLNEESWGKKKLTYEIGKNPFGIYEFLLVEMDSVAVKELERTLRLSEEIIRSIVVQAEEEVEPKKRDMTKVIKKAKTEPRETVVKEKKEIVRKEVQEPKKTKAAKEKEEKERQKELDEKLQEIIGPDKES